MKKISIILVSVAVLTLSILVGNVYAEAVGDTYRWVSVVNVGETNHVQIGVIGNYGPKHGCKQPWYGVIKWPMTDIRSKTIVDLAITSLVARIPVYITSDGCTDYGHLVITGFQLQQLNP